MSNEKETKVSALDAKAKALANEEDEDTKIAKLLKNMPKWRFYSLAVLTVIWTVFQLYIKLVKPLDPWFQLPLHMCLALVVVWLYNPMVERATISCGGSTTSSSSRPAASSAGSS